MASQGNQAVHLKREILVRVLKAFLKDDFAENVRLIPYDMRPKGCEVPYRCCVYKERAIIKDRTIAGLGISIEEDDEKTLLSHYAQKALNRDVPDENALTVLETACKGCVPSRVFVTNICQGCVARPCISSCSFGAISIVDGKSVIDGEKCKGCMKCIKVCPYNAIVKIRVPCEDSCPVDAVHKDENGHAKIDFDKCKFDFFTSIIFCNTFFSVFEGSLKALSLTDKFSFFLSVVHFSLEILFEFVLSFFLSSLDVRSLLFD